MMIRYAIYQPADSAEMVRLLAEAFTLHDPPAVALGLQAEDFAPLLNCSFLMRPPRPPRSSPVLPTQAKWPVHSLPRTQPRACLKA
jgi:hypothetical protein